jgi:hypothetical protein
MEKFVSFDFNRIYEVDDHFVVYLFNRKMDGVKAKINENDYTTVKKYKWQLQQTGGYTKTKIEGKYIYLHRLIMKLIVGRELEGEENIHHINGDKLDNRRENLKLYKTKAEHTRCEKHWQKIK